MTTQRTPEIESEYGLDDAPDGSVLIDYACAVLRFGANGGERHIGIDMEGHATDNDATVGDLRAAGILDEVYADDDDAMRAELHHLRTDVLDALVSEQAGVEQLARAEILNLQLTQLRDDFAGAHLIYHSPRGFINEISVTAYGTTEAADAAVADARPESTCYRISLEDCIAGIRHWSDSANTHNNPAADYWPSWSEEAPRIAVPVGSVEYAVPVSPCVSCDDNAAVPGQATCARCASEVEAGDA